MEPGPIPWTAIREYGRCLELDDDQLSDLHYHVREMDLAYRRHVQESSRANRK